MFFFKLFSLILLVLSIWCILSLNLSPLLIFVCLFIYFIFILLLVQRLISRKNKISKSVYVYVFVILPASFVAAVIIASILVFHVTNLTTIVNSTVNTQTLDFINAQPRPKTYKRRLFFIESSQEKLEFSTKELCAIESAAKHNKNTQIQVYSFRAQLPKNTGLREKYPNLRVINTNFDQLFRDTPLDAWWRSGLVLKSPYYLVHSSDAARLAVLWKQAGMYLDMDFLVLKNLEHLFETGNGCASIYDRHVGNAFLIFNSSRHEFLNQVMLELRENYYPDSWADNGPNLLIEMLRNYCNLNENYTVITSRMNRLGEFSAKCHDLVIYPEAYFYPFHFYDDGINVVFKKDALISSSIEKKLKQAYTVHLFNALTKNDSVDVNDEHVLFNRIARSNCDVTFNYAKSRNLSFQ